jgi:hypothetical protein
MKEYAHQKGLKRWMVPIPLLTPYLSSFWLGLVTPLYARVGRKLIESAICSTVVHDPLAANVFQMKPISYKEAIARAVKNENNAAPETRWNGALSATIRPRDFSQAIFGGRLLNVKQAVTHFSPEEAFIPIRKIGGQTGYYALNWLWRWRGAIDYLCGGVGFRRGRRDPENIRPGDVIDFWRVISYVPGSSLKLQAEMKTPGRAILELTVNPHEHGSQIIQKAIFDPIGIMGILYWYLLYPIHYIIFKRMIRGIIKNMGKRK